jgi:hypothetical protein
MIRKLAPALLLALAVSLPAGARAESFTMIGPHLGFSTSPDQVVFGGQMQFGDVAPQIDFLPGIDFGFGDDMTVISLNGDFHYRFEIAGKKWQPYVGGGVAIHFVSWDNAGPGTDNSDTEGGGTLIFGADVPTKSGSRFFVEGKIGLGDGPDFKALAGWNFKLK